MADWRETDIARLPRVGICRTPRGTRTHSIRRAHEAFVKRCAEAGFHLVEHGTLVPFSPWTCATCRRRDDLVVAGAIAFCRSCLEAAPPEDAEDLYQDTGGGD